MSDDLEKDITAPELNVEHDEHSDEKSEDPIQQIDWSVRQIIATASLCALYVGSQMGLYFVGGSLSYMAAELGGEALSASVWLPVSNTLALASTAPFSGYLTDLFGRRNITLGGSLFVIVGWAIVGSAHSFSQGFAGMAIAGAGAGVGELSALAGVAELVPVKMRGFYGALVLLFLIPITPYVMYSQLLSTRTEQGWRWGMWISVMYNAIAFFGIAASYFPEKHQVIDRGSKMEVLKKIDYVGALLSITGITLFLVAIQSGGYTYPWSSAYVLCTLIIGLLLIAAFVIWEWKFAKLPMVPREMFAGQRTVGMAFLVAFVGGMNFYSLINFFPLTFSTVFDPDPVQVGLKGLGYGISVTAGATTVNALLSLFKNHNRELLVVSCIIMTAFSGALAAVTPDTPGLAVALGTIAGFGVGGILVPAATVAMTVCPDHLISTTVALSLSIRVIGGSIGYAIYFNIFVEKLTAALPVNIGTAAVTAGLPPSSAVEFVTDLLTNPSALSTVKGVTPAVLAAAGRAVQDSYAYALSYVWYTSIAFGIVSIIAAALVGNNSKFLTDRIAAKIRH